MRHFVTELKRRNVIRMAGLYLVGAWLVVQVAGTLLPAFEAPAWVMKTLVGLLAVGLVPALVFSWVFELTPQGLRRDTEVLPQESIAPQTGRRMERITLMLFALALAYFGFDKFVLAPRRDAALVAATTSSVAASSVAEAKTRTNPNSIAVLPFVNMSGDAANDYFSDGISEEILNVLARAPELQVAARTSSFSFKGKSRDVPAIARELKVRMVLEGSVRKQADRVRITAQLIDAENGFQLWSQSFDRKLEDIFAIQDEIAKAIGDELKVNIVEGAQPGGETPSVRNIEAYDLYLRGMQLWQSRGDQDLWDAVAALERATTLEPRFAQAYAGLSQVYAVLPNYSRRIAREPSHARATDNAERALALDPSLPDPYAVLGYLASESGLRRDTAQLLYQRAIALRPSFMTAHRWAGRTLAMSGDLAGALAAIERAAVLDPRSQIVAENRAMVLMMLGRNAEAVQACDATLALIPDWPPCLRRAALAELLLGRVDAAQARFERLAKPQSPAARALVAQLFEVLAGRGDRHALALRIAAEPIPGQEDEAVENMLGWMAPPVLLVLLGERELALDTVERQYARYALAPEASMFLTALDPIRCEPRFVALVERQNTTDPHFARVCKPAP